MNVNRVSWRRISQYLTLAAFLALFALTSPRFAGMLPVGIFFRLNPFVALGVIIASRTLLALFALSLPVAVTALVVGRVWCGWICPLGTLLDLLPSRSRSRLNPVWYRTKYIILLSMLIVAGGGLSLAAGLDPLTILVRFFDAVVGKSGRALSAGALLALPLVAILALNGLVPRFWCRMLCPLGALLGIGSRFTPVHLEVGASCTGCGLCADRCPVGAIVAAPRLYIIPSECILCFSCYDDCPRGAVSLKLRWPPSAGAPYWPERRAFLVSAVVGGAALLLARGTSHPGRLRPPGASEGSLFSLCIRCGQCLRVCPTGALQPDGASLAGLWTPIFVPRRGYCSYNCNACGAVCPTGAIPYLSLEEKRVTVIGRAVVDAEHCLAWAELQPCDVCYKTCPLPNKAVEMVEIEAVNELGEVITVKCPQVIEELCTGCGICEYNCPAPGPGAIRVL